MSTEKTIDANCLNTVIPKKTSYDGQEIEYIEKGDKEKEVLILIPGTAGDCKIFC